MSKYKEFLCNSMGELYFQIAVNDTVRIHLIGVDLPDCLARVTGFEKIKNSHPGKSTRGRPIVQIINGATPKWREQRLVPGRYEIVDMSFRRPVN